MGIKSFDETPKSFDVRVKADGERGQRLFRIVNEKKKKDNRKTLIDTVEAIILEYGSRSKSKVVIKKNKKVSAK